VVASFPLGLPFDLPFDDPAAPSPFRVRPGLRPLDPADWLLFDDDYDADLAEKQRLLAERHADVVAALPGTEEAAREVLDAVREVVAGRRRPVRDADPGLHPIDAAGRLVQEDLCLLLPGPDGFVLAAASVCFPLRWRLASKLGRTVGEIHGPVPHYGADAGAAVDRILARLRPEAPLWRRNWTVVDDPARHQQVGHDRTERNADVTADNAGRRAWVRVERQTLRAFAGHGSVLFTIRTYQRRLDALASDRDLAARLAATMRAVPTDTAAYKSLPTLSDAVLAWLDRVAAGGRDANGGHTA
jgi:hypothetical protein